MAKSSLLPIVLLAGGAAALIAMSGKKKTTDAGPTPGPAPGPKPGPTPTAAPNLMVVKGNQDQSGVAPLVKKINDPGPVLLISNDKDALARAKEMAALYPARSFVLTDFSALLPDLQAMGKLPDNQDYKRLADFLASQQLNYSLLLDSSQSPSTGKGSLWNQALVDGDFKNKPIGNLLFGLLNELPDMDASESSDPVEAAAIFIESAEDINGILANLNGFMNEPGVVTRMVAWVLSRSPAMPPRPPIAPPNPGSPASEFCASQGGELFTMRGTPGAVLPDGVPQYLRDLFSSYGEFTMCMLPNKTAIEEWDFYRGEADPSAEVYNYLLRNGRVPKWERLGPPRPMPGPMPAPVGPVGPVPPSPVGPVGPLPPRPLAP